MPTNTQVSDPALAHAAEGSESEGVPPPSAYTGISKQLPAGTTLQDGLQMLFELETSEPGLLRLHNSFKEILHPSTRVDRLQAPRMIYIHMSSYTAYQKLEKLIESLDHDLVLTRSRMACEPLQCAQPSFRRFSDFASIHSMGNYLGSISKYDTLGALEDCWEPFC